MAAAGVARTQVGNRMACRGRATGRRTEEEGLTGIFYHDCSGAVKDLRLVNERNNEERDMRSI